MSADPREAFRDLLRLLSDLYAAEGREGGERAADAYRLAADTRQDIPVHPPYRLNAQILAASAGASHPAAVAARMAHPVLRWSATGILDEHIPAKVSDVFAVVSLIGPGAMIEAEGVRSGLYVQTAGTYYPLHAHAAEETYAMLAGEAEWTCNGAISRHGAGDFIHHPSYAGHATRTFATPVMAAWRWSGDIGLETYRLLEDHA